MCRYLIPAARTFIYSVRYTRSVYTRLLTPVPDCAPYSVTVDSFIRRAKLVFCFRKQINERRVFVNLRIKYYIVHVLKLFVACVEITRRNTGHFKWWFMPLVLDFRARRSERVFGYLSFHRVVSCLKGSEWIRDIGIVYRTFVVYFRAIFLFH